MNQKFQEISEEVSDKKLQKTAISLHAKYKPTLAKELERASRFAYDLYFKNHIEQANKVIEVVVREKFNGNYNLWTWIEDCLFLKCWILENSNQSNKDKEIEKTIEIIKETFNFNKDEAIRMIGERGHKRLLTGSLLIDDRIEIAIQENEKKDEIDYRKIQFSNLLYIYFFGGSEIYPKEKALGEILKNQEIIRQYLKVI